MDIINQLKELDKFTYSEQDVIHYMLEHLEEIPTLSIQQLAKQAYTSNAIIIRICKKVNVKGFKEFKVLLSRELEASKYLNNDVNYTIPFNQEDNNQDIINKMSSLHRNSIDMITSSLNTEILNHIANRIISSKHVFFYAVGDSHISCMSIMNRLIKLGIYCIDLTSNNEENVFLDRFNVEDIIIFVSYSGNKRINDYFKKARQKGCTTVMISANTSSIVSKYSDFFICIPNKEEENKISTFYSQIAFQYIFNIIYAIIYSKV